MTIREAFDVATSALGPEGLDCCAGSGDSYLLVSVAKLHALAQLFRDDPRLCCEQLHLITGVDTGQELWVVYHLFSFRHRAMYELKVRLPVEAPSVPTVSDLWPAANWHERETFDLLGIRFEGHPDLRRILLMPEWIGHPLRKDYRMPVKATMPPTRQPATAPPVAPGAVAGPRTA